MGIFNKTDSFWMHFESNFARMLTNYMIQKSSTVYLVETRANANNNHANTLGFSNNINIAVSDRIEVSVLGHRQRAVVVNSSEFHYNRIYFKHVASLIVFVDSGFGRFCGKVNNNTHFFRDFV